MGKGRGKGGRHRAVHYASSAEQIDRRNKRDAEYAAKRNNRRGIETSNDGEEGSSSENEDDNAQAAAPPSIPRPGEGDAQLDELTRARMEAQRILEKGEDGQEAVNDVLAEGVENLNRNRKQNISVKDIVVTNVPQSRRDREREEAAKRQAEYDRRHALGETAQAKKDLERLRLIRAARAKAAKARAANPKGRPADYKTPPTTESDSDSDSDSESSSESEEVVPSEAAAAAKKEKKEKKAKKKEKKEKKEQEGPKKPVFTKIEAKKMKPPKMKELLKELGESTQGNKKQLLARLLPHAS